MKKVFAILAAGLICLGAFAQESAILEEWGDKLELSDSDVITPISFVSFFYNHNLGALEGQSRHGFGFEVATMFLGFDIWKGARLSLGLLDFCADFSSTLNGYVYAQSKTDNNKIEPYNTNNPEFASLGIGLENLESKWSSFAFLFPITYTQKFGSSKWDLALLAAPGVGFDSYNNKFTVGNIEHNSKLNLKKNAYFRLNLSAYVRYNGLGIGVRYSFPREFQGPGIISAGITLGI